MIKQLFSHIAIGGGGDDERDFLKLILIGCTIYSNKSIWNLYLVVATSTNCRTKSDKGYAKTLYRREKSV